GARPEALHESAAVRVANTSRVGDPRRRDRRHVDTLRPMEYRRSVLAAGDDQMFGALQDVGLAEAGFLANQLELVVVADDEIRAVDAIGELGSAHAGALLARVENKTDAERPALFGVLRHRRGIVRRDDDEIDRTYRAK